MDWLSEFQQSLREPVFGFVRASWPFIAPLLIAAIIFGVGWYVSSQLSQARRHRRGDVGGDSSVGFSADGSRSDRDRDMSDANSDSGDSGGGGDGGGGD